jgi:hypothetical protein
LPEAVETAQAEFDKQLAVVLDGMAERMDGKPLKGDSEFEAAFERLREAAASSESEGSSKQLPTFLLLAQRSAALIQELDQLMEEHRGANR